MKSDYIFKENTKYEILTPSGFQMFSGIRKVAHSQHYEFIFSNGIFLKCSLTHKFMRRGVEISADLLNIGDTVDSIDGGIVSIISKTVAEGDISLFDVVNVNGGNIFNVDGIISHNCDFISSGDTVIDPQILQFYKNTYVIDPIERTGIDGNLWKWQYPNYSKSYMVVADVARGDATDYSAAHVIEVESCEQVAEYRGKLDTKDFGNFLVTLSTEYNNALLVIENSNIGWATIQQCIDRNYQNLYYMSKDLRYVDVENQLSNRYHAEERSMVAGFSTTSRTRPLIISKLEEYVRTKSVIIRSVRAIDELFTFIWFNGRAEAMRGYNDDLTMSLAISLWVRDTALRLRQEGIELTRKTIDGITYQNYSGIYGGEFNGDNPWHIRVGGETEDLSKWL